MITDEIAQQRRIHGAHVDENVFVALKLGVLTQKHILVTAKHSQTAAFAVGTILNTIWGLKATVFQCQHTSTRDEIVEFMFDGVVGGSMGMCYVFQDLDVLPMPLQSVLLGFMRARNVRRGEQIIHVNELFTVVGIMGEKGKLYPLLTQEFWFKQSYERPELIPEPFPKCQELNRAQVAHFSMLRTKDREVVIVPEIRRYMYDIIIHIRCHRCVSTGFPTRSIADIELLSRCLCLLFDREFVIPTIVKLACRKLVPFKITMVEPELEPTLQYGSDQELVKELMARMTPKMVLEDVLRKVAPPL